MYTITSPNVSALVSGTQLDDLPDGVVDNPNPPAPGQADQNFDFVVGGTSAVVNTSVTTAVAITWSPQISFANVSGSNKFRFATYTFKCTPKPPPTGKITIIKNNIGGKSGDVFTVQAQLGANSPVSVPVTTSTIISGGFSGTADTGQIPTGSYTVSETGYPTGTSASDWTTTVSCSGNGSSGSTAIVSNGGNVTCTVTNTKKAKLTIKKDVPGVSDSTQFSFTKSGQGGNSTFNLTDGGAGQEFTATGTYTIVEDGETGYTLTNIACTGTGANGTGDSTTVGTKTAVVKLDPGEDITCTYTNTKNAKLTIVKDVPGVSDSTQFSFTKSGQGGNSTFNLTDGGAGQEFTATGTYTIVEDGETGYTLSNIACTGTGANGTGDLTSVGDKKAVVKLDPGENITCTYTNTKNAKLTIKKDVPGVSDSTQFSFTKSGQGGNTTFNQTDGGTGQEFTATGTYTIVEDGETGYTLTNIACTGTGANGTGDSTNVGTKTAVVKLDAGEDITCTYTNTKNAKLTIKKDVPGISDSTQFSFTKSGQGGNSNFNLTDGGAGQEFTATGTYTIVEDGETGYTLTNIACTGTGANGTGDSTTVGTKTAVVKLDAGEDITCTFTNTKKRKLTVTKVTEGGDSDFDFTVNQGATQVGTADNLSNGESKDFDLLPGAYSVRGNQHPGRLDVHKRQLRLWPIDQQSGERHAAGNLGRHLHLHQHQEGQADDPEDDGRRQRRLRLHADRTLHVPAGQ